MTPERFGVSNAIEQTLEDISDLSESRPLQPKLTTRKMVFSTKLDHPQFISLFIETTTIRSDWLCRSNNALRTRKIGQKTPPNLLKLVLSAILPVEINDNKIQAVADEIILGRETWNSAVRRDRNIR